MRKKIKATICVCAIVGIGIAVYFASKPIMGTCLICNQPKTDDLIFVDTRSGYSYELDVWTPDLDRIGDAGPWELQLLNGDRSTFRHLGENRGYYITHMGGGELVINIENEKTSVFLCPSHSEHKGSCVLVDTKDEPNKAYIAKDSAEYEIRHFTANIVKEDGEYRINVESSLYADEVRIWEESQREQ